MLSRSTLNPTQIQNSQIPVGSAQSAVSASLDTSSKSAQLTGVLTAVLVAGLALLVSFSIYLSQHRIYQVDECQNLYMAKVLAAGQSSHFFTSSALFLFGPLSWLLQMHVRSAEMYSLARLLFQVVFWLNLLLLAAIARARVPSGKLLIALLGAATLAPLWDYGFEIRHDNLVLLGILLIWWLVRVKSLGIPSYVAAGAITVVLLFIAVKTLVYVAPLSAAVLLFPPPGHNKSRWVLGTAWIGGAVAAGLVIFSCESKEAWDSYLAVFRVVSKYSAVKAAGAGAATTTSRFAPWGTLARLLNQTPLLLALTVGACVSVLGDLFRHRRAALTWNGLFPEFLLVIGALAGLMANPNPFPYNLVHVVPYAFLFAYPYAALLWRQLRVHAVLVPVSVAVVIILHLIPFGLATSRHLDYPNTRQDKLMNLAEDLTDPADDQVYDATGMVLTRWSIHYHWYLHSLNAAFITKPGFRVRDMLAAKPAAVFIPSYRTDWLQKEDHEFISSRYVPLADDFWVLGNILPAGGGSIEIVHPGRYCVVPVSSLEVSATTTKAPAATDSSMTGSLDGVALSGKPIDLAVGTHRLETAGNTAPSIVWVGPTLESVPHLSPGNHRFLFQNWY